MQGNPQVFVRKCCTFAVCFMAAHVLSGGEITEKYYRLAIREIGGGDIVQLGEFSL